MWLVVVYAIATFGVAGCLWINRSKCQACPWVGLILLAAWSSNFIANRIGGFALSHYVGAAMDTACATACAIVWLKARRVWPLLLMILFMMQETAHLQTGSHATYDQSYRLAVTLNVLNAMQLAVALVGPHVSDWIRVLLRMLADRRSSNRAIARLRSGYQERSFRQ